jgi:RecG-like helicase
MKTIKSLTAVLCALALLGGVSLARAADESKTITGEGKCAKCALKEKDSCQNVVQVKDGDKTVTYYLVHNDVSKAFHENICKKTEKVTATGTVKKVDGKLELTPTRIEVAK